MRKKRIIKVSSPGVVKKAIHLTKAVSKHIADNRVELTQSKVQERLDICNQCVNHEKGVCNHPECGCALIRKALWRSEDCPEGYWPKL